MSESPKLVILDGCDKTGKSTLAKRIASTTGWPCKHFPRSRESDLFTKYLNVLNDIHAPLIADRFYTSELVYGPALRGCSRLGPEQIMKLNKKTREVGCCFILCHADPQIIERRIVTEREDHIAADQVCDIVLRFEELAGQLEAFFKVYRIDTSTETDSNAFVEQVVHSWFR